MSLNMQMSLEEYVLCHIDEEGELLAHLNRDAHVNLLRPRMLSGHLQGRMLKLFCRMLSPKRILEIGTYTGYATLCMAEALPKDGIIDTIEINDELEDFILKQFNRSPDKDKIRLHIGDATEIIPSLSETYDLVFIDADKKHIVYIRFKLKPCAVVRNDGCAINRHKRLVRLFVKINAGASDNLRNNNTLGAVYDKRAALCHNREISHKDFLLFYFVSFLVAKPNGNL